MEKRPKYQFEPNTPKFVKFENCTPFWEGGTGGRQSYGFEAEIDGKECVFFADQKLRDEIVAYQAPVTLRINFAVNEKGVRWWEVVQPIFDESGAITGNAERPNLDESVEADKFFLDAEATLVRCMRSALKVVLAYNEIAGEKAMMSDDIRSIGMGIWIELQRKLRR